MSAHRKRISNGRDAMTLELLASLSYAVGQYIECDERPRPLELWAAMCEAQERAAIYLNTGRVA